MTPSPPANELDADLGERHYKGDARLEVQHIDEIVSMIARSIKGHFDQGKGIARRDAHAYDNGCVRAIFRVDANLHPDLQHGVFVPGREYRAWIRFSNGNSEARSRWFPDARGMAIKLTGVAGEKLMSDEQHTQDFILITHPKFFVDDLERYKATLEAFLKGGIFDQFVRAILALRGRERLIALCANLRWITNPLLHQYWSMTPYRLGVDKLRKTAVKYSAKPRIAEPPPLLRRVAAFFSWNFSPKQQMSNSLARREMEFDFYVQRWARDERTPIEDSKVEWREAVSPLEHVAKIVIPVQDIMSAEQARFCENLSFSPWHSLHEHRPLGLVNRVRREAYRRISELRHTLNKAPTAEPTGDETFGRGGNAPAQAHAQAPTG